MSKKIFRYMLLMFIVLSLFITVWTVRVAVSLYRQETVEQLKSVAECSKIMLSEMNTDTLNYDALAHKLSLLTQDHRLRITFIDMDGKVLGDSDISQRDMDNHAERQEVLAARSGNVGTAIRYSSSMAEDMMYVAIPNQQNSFIIRVSTPLLYSEKIRSSLWLSTLAAWFICLLLAALCSWLLARYLTRNVRQIAATAQKLAQGNYGLQTDLAIDDSELIPLNEVVNTMSRELAEKIRHLSAVNSELQAVLDNLPCAIIAIDHNNKVLLTNKALLSIFNLKHSENTKGKNIREVLRNETVLQQLRRTLQYSERLQQELITPDKQLWVETVLISSANDTNQATGSMALIHDMTRIKQLEKLRTDFVANVTHELKSPLTSIRGFIEVLRTEETSAKDAQRFLDIIDLESERLSSLINDILLLSEIEAGDLSENSELIDIHNVITAVLPLCKKLAAEYQVSIIYQETDSSTFCRINRNRLKQLLLILLDNAIKYNREGGTASIAVQSTPAAVLIKVSDSGIGIEEHHLARIYERFYRVDKGRSRDTGGTGLGLAIAKHIVQRYNGSISMDSIYGQGTTITVSLPNTDTP